MSQPWPSTRQSGPREWNWNAVLAALLQEAGVHGAVDVVFTGADHGVERGVEQDYERALPLTEALRHEDVLVAHHDVPSLSRPSTARPVPPRSCRAGTAWPT